MYWRPGRRRRVEKGWVETRNTNNTSGQQNNQHRQHRQERDSHSADNEVLGQHTPTKQEQVHAVMQGRLRDGQHIGLAIAGAIQAHAAWPSPAEEHVSEAYSPSGRREARASLTFNNDAAQRVGLSSAGTGTAAAVSTPDHMRVSHRREV